MKIYIAVNEDYDTWASLSFKGLIAQLEDDCGGHYTSCTATHHVKLEYDTAKEAIGWKLQWKDGEGSRYPEYNVYVSRTEVLR